MLFNSQIFLFVFLPITVALVLSCSLLGRTRAAKLVLAFASLVFYGYWSLPWLCLLLALVAFNYGAGRLLIRLRAQPGRERIVTTCLVAALVVNIGVLAVFKYTHFATQVLHDVGLPVDMIALALPLGLSFIIFQKIAFLVDVAGGVVGDFDLVDYILFVSFFPQLIAGPIVHHRDIIPQLRRVDALRPRAGSVAAGLSLLIVGLAKKVLLADTLAMRATPIFEASSAGQTFGFFMSWCGGALYGLQLYFDFSGYCDMAVGLGLLFGVRLPINFNSPFKAATVVEFWQRWHMTLTSFLTSYLYNPLVMRATRRRAARGLRPLGRGKMNLTAFASLLAVPTLTTMFIAGIWHGAGFQFMAFGFLHGAFMVVNHAWKTFRRRDAKPLPRWLATVLTTAAVVFTFVFFRATTMRSALSLAESMMGLHGLGFEPAVLRRAAVAGAGFLAVWFLPNSQQLIPGVTQEDMIPLGGWRRFVWQPSIPWALGMATLAVLGILQLTKSTEFLYFNF
jgi:alginate O-acetyltransferase complex protein AlgI